MMIQEFQNSVEFQYLMMTNNCESIDDLQNRQKDRFALQIVHDQLQWTQDYTES
jgi:hypothetical protein